MPDLILHHYPNSPFSEKVRLVLGYKGLAWKSVHIPVVMPKPDVVALTGGYRRTPFMQVGADIYCDSALICDLLDRLAPRPALYPDAAGAQARLLAQWADSTLFWTAVPYTMQPAGMAHIFAGLPPEGVKAFAADRAAFRGNALRLSLPELTGHLRVYLDWIEGMFVDGRAFVTGSEPSVADFAIYHAIWFVRRAPPVATILDPCTRLAAWFARMQAFGHGASEPLSSGEAIEIARGATPAPATAPLADVHGLTPGDRVVVMPVDTGIEPVEGELVISAPNEIAIRRIDARAGELVVHFPRTGFQMKKADKEKTT